VAPLNRFLAGVLDLVLWPVQGLPAIVGLGVMALVTAIAVLVVYGRTSDQAGIEAVRRTIVAALLEMRLFRDDLVVVFRAQTRVLRASARYFRYSLVPLAWLLVPLAVLFIHLDRIYGFAPVDAGATFLVEVSARDVDRVELEAVGGLRVETPPLRIPAREVVNWRLRAVEEGRQTITVTGARGVAHAKTVLVGPAGTPVVPVRPSRHLVDQLLHPGEPPLPEGDTVERITVGYERSTVPFLGWDLHWAIPFLVLTMAFGFALQKPLGVRL
jgi:hypothetical protein